jgi:cobalt-zinc-cadmium efflux system membrane fusion protein
LTKIQLDRTKLLYEGGAVAKSVLDVAQTAEDTAVVDVQTTEEHLHVLGSTLRIPMDSWKSSRRFQA